MYLMIIHSTINVNDGELRTIVNRQTQILTNSIIKSSINNDVSNYLFTKYPTRNLIK